MNKITFGELLDLYIELTGEEEKRSQLINLKNWIVSYERKDGTYNVLIEPPDIER